MKTIEQYETSIAGSERFCCTRAIVGCSFSEDGRAAVWKKGVGCGRWECPECAKLKLKKLRRRVWRTFGNETLRLLTLTVATGEWTEEESLFAIKSAWDVLLKRLRRRYPKLKFFLVFELTKRGYPHLHILLNQFIPHRWLSAAWGEIMRSPIVHIERTQDVGAVRYIMKYLGKFAGKEGGINEVSYRFGIRRFSFSRDFLAHAEKWRSRIFYRGKSHWAADICFDSLCAEFGCSWDYVGCGKDGLVVFFGESPPSVGDGSSVDDQAVRTCVEITGGRNE